MRLKPFILNIQILLLNLARFSNVEDRANILIRVAELEDVDRITKLADSLGYSTSINEMQLRLKRLISRAEHAIYVAQLLEEPVAGWVHLDEERSILCNTIEHGLEDNIDFYIVNSPLNS